VALSALMAEVDNAVRAERLESVHVGAHDMTALAYAWLNELIGLAAVERAAVVEIDVQAVGWDEETDEYRLSATVGLRRHDEPSVRPLHDVKSATYHGLVIERDGGRWQMEAYVDI
jgi:SHS2 domain-containing protein